ncbi:unnamed protein product [Closterium sp. Naga37s-1]|nr:unnamed protein product [Closterium sp. Naga37s-1]
MVLVASSRISLRSIQSSCCVSRHAAWTAPLQAQPRAVRTMLRRSTGARASFCDGSETVAREGDMVNVKFMCKTLDGEVLHASGDDDVLTFEVGAGNFVGNPLFKEDGGERRGSENAGPKILSLEELQLKAKQQWSRHFPWLIIGDTAEGRPCMRCKICMVYADPESQYDARGEGGIDIQKQTMRKHQWSIRHREAKDRLEQREAPQKRRASISNFGDKSMVSSSWSKRWEALAAKDAAEEFPEFNVVDKVVRSFADILGRSIVQHARFKKLQEFITETNLEMQGIKDVRWLSRGDAIQRFADVLPAAVVLLHEYDKTTYTLVTSLKFQFFLFFLVDVLQELNSLNLKFQRRQLDATQVRPMVQHTTLILTSRYVEYGSTFGDNSGRLATFLKNHGSTEQCKVKVESIDTAGEPVTHTYLLHEDLIGKEKFGGDLASCVEAASKFAGRTVFFIEDRMKSLKSLDGARLFRQGRYSRSRAKRARRFPEWLESLRNLFKKKPNHPDTLPGKRFVSNLRFYLLRYCCRAKN